MLQESSDLLTQLGPNVVVCEVRAEKAEFRVLILPNLVQSAGECCDGADERRISHEGSESNANLGAQSTLMCLTMQTQQHS